MSVVKGPRPAGVPSLFLPANENESRMPHSVSSPLLLNKGDSPQLTNNTHHPNKDARLKGCAVTTRTCSHFQCPTMLHINTHSTNADGEWAVRDVAKRPKWLDKGLKRGKTVPRLVRTKLSFFSMVDLNAPSHSAASLRSSRPVHMETNPVTHQAPSLYLAMQYQTITLLNHWLLTKPDQIKN